MKNCDTIAIVGLGYVGLPLAVAFGARRMTIGFDMNVSKVAAYREGRDPSGEVSAAQLAAAVSLNFATEPSALAQASVIIVVVPTPIDAANRPDLRPLETACRVVAEHMSPGSIIVFESTVYPGCTEEICVPILEAVSGLRWLGRDMTAKEPESRSFQSEGFHVGYSPERINPGDTSHRLESIVKVVAGDSTNITVCLAELYGSVVDAGIHCATSIKVAEAAKVIENTQRDLNIALMNELSMIFDRLGVDTLDVLEAAGTKWNFLPFRPGLVGGHCIGVDPYYLTYRAERAGYHPQVVLAGRRINDGMSKFIAEKTVKSLAGLGRAITKSRVTVLGLTFKENCSDLRNSRVPDIVGELESYGCIVEVHDPIADPEDARQEYGIILTDIQQLERADALVLAVAHDAYRRLDHQLIYDLVDPGGVLIDVKGFFERSSVDASGLSLWRL